MGDFDGRMRPLFRFSSRNLSSSFCSFNDIGYSLQAVGEEPGIISMARSHVRLPGNSSNESFENTSWKPQYLVGIMSSSGFLSCLAASASARCAEIVEQAWMWIGA